MMFSLSVISKSKPPGSKFANIWKQASQANGIGRI